MFYILKYIIIYIYIYITSELHSCTAFNLNNFHVPIPHHVFNTTRKLRM